MFYYDVRERILAEGVFLSAGNSTVRKTAAHFNVSKSTVHKDLSEKLPYIDKNLYIRVEKVLKKNLSERHVRGGEATKRKYADAKKK